MSRSVEVAGSHGEANYRDARLFLLVTSTSTITATQTSTTTAYTGESNTDQTKTDRPDFTGKKGGLFFTQVLKFYIYVL